MSATHRPRLRPYLGVVRLDPREAQGSEFILHDRLRVAHRPLPLTHLELECLRLFDGTRTLLEVQMEVIRRLGGQIVPLDWFASLAERLELLLYLDSPRFHEVASSPVRRPSCIGVYPADPAEFRLHMRSLFQHPLASGLPGKPGTENRVRAILAPHIDFHRGGLAYTFPFKELFENTPASLFVIIGTSHYCGWRRFTLTRKDFQTPLGIVPTDQQYIDRLADHYAADLFEDELIAHLPEHSIELEVAFLHYLYERKRDIRIVPLVVGSFDDCVRSGETPDTREEIRRMVQALQAVERETREPICYIISGDLAHIGPKFGAADPVGQSQLTHSRQRDDLLLQRLEQVQYDRYFDLIAEERDERNICGLSPTWITLAATQPESARMVKYEQYVDPTGYESVSFASMVFYR